MEAGCVYCISAVLWVSCKKCCCAMNVMRHIQDWILRRTTQHNWQVRLAITHACATLHRYAGVLATGAALVYNEPWFPCLGCVVLEHHLCARRRTCTLACYVDLLPFCSLLPCLCFIAVDENSPIWMRTCQFTLHGNQTACMHWCHATACPWCLARYPGDCWAPLMRPPPGPPLPYTYVRIA